MSNDLATLKTFFLHNFEVRRKLDYIENFNYNPLATIQLERHGLQRLNPQNPHYYVDSQTANVFLPIVKKLSEIRNLWMNPNSYNNDIYSGPNPHFMRNVFFSEIQYVPARPETDNEHLFHFKMIYHSGLTNIGSCWIDFYVGHHREVIAVPPVLYFWYTINDFEYPDHRLRVTDRFACQDNLVLDHENTIRHAIQSIQNGPGASSRSTMKRGMDDDSEHDLFRARHAARQYSQFFPYY